MKMTYESPLFKKWPISIDEELLLNQDASAGSFDDDWVVDNPNLDDF